MPDELLSIADEIDREWEFSYSEALVPWDGYNRSFWNTTWRDLLKKYILKEWSAYDGGRKEILYSYLQVADKRDSINPIISVMRDLGVNLNDVMAYHLLNTERIDDLARALREVSDLEEVEKSIYRHSSAGDGHVSYAIYMFNEMK